MSDVSWLDDFLDDTAKIQITENELIVNLLHNLFDKSDSFFTSPELDERFNEVTELHSISILAHEIYYLVNRYEHHDPSYYRSVCLRLLAIRCFMLLLDEKKDDVDIRIQQLDLHMNCYTDHTKYLNEIAYGENIVLCSSVLTSLCLQLLHMGSSTKHFSIVKTFVIQNKNQKFAQDVLNYCFLENELGKPDM